MELRAINLTVKLHVYMHIFLHVRGLAGACPNRGQAGPSPSRAREKNMHINVQFYRQLIYPQFRLVAAKLNS